MTKMTVGEALIKLLEQAGVDTVFGIPGVHTIELYRGLDASPIRHVTPRHEQGAAFMADGYARITGKPGICLLITGPGLSNAATGIVQARNDSIPMLVITAVNRSDSLGKELGHLHELPDQAAFAASIFLDTHRLLDPDDLEQLFHRAFLRATSGRPGPVHLEIPTDVMKMQVAAPLRREIEETQPTIDDALLEQAAELSRTARHPVIILGGGAASKTSQKTFVDLAERLDAPVISTAHARGIMGGHPLGVPASPSLTPVRDLIASSDVVLVFGSEMAPTDYDMYQTGALPAQANVIRIDIDPAQFAKRDDAGLMITADANTFARALGAQLSPRTGDGRTRARQTNAAAQAALPSDYPSHIKAIEAIWSALPDACIIGDSTQPVYAGNLVLNAPRPKSWFNSSSGFGTLGYAVPAAIGASIADPQTPIICLTGDGGLQFTLPELATARDINANVAFVVWNNMGYREIETSMRDAGVSPVGVTPTPPDLEKLAAAYELPFVRITDPNAISSAVASTPRPCLIEYFCR